MNIHIYADNQKIITEIPPKLTVEELLSELKNNLGMENKNFILLNSNFELMKNKDPVISSTNKKSPSKYFLIESTIKKNPIKTENIEINEKIENIIMKNTGATKPITQQQHRLISPHGLTFFDILNNNNNNNDGADRLLNLFQLLEENNFIIRGPNINEINNNPVEVNEQHLRELIDMGFPEDRARNALISTRNNISRATEILLGEPDS